MGGVQSVPRVMRSLPAIVPRMFDVPLTASGRELEIYNQQGRLSGLGGLESQGLARTLGSLGGRTLGEEIEMPEECMRPGEILLAPGVCGPDPRRPVDPYAAAPPTSAIPVSTTKAKAAASASSVAAGMSRTTMALAAIGAIGLLYYLGKGKRRR